MTIEIAMLVLTAAFLHAGWNALVKTASDRLLVISAVAFAQFLAGAVIIPFVAVPDMVSWPAIGLSTLFHYFLVPSATLRGCFSSSSRFVFSPSIGVGVG